MRWKANRTCIKLIIPKHVYIIHFVVPELAGVYCGQLLSDPLVFTKGGTKKSSGGGFRIGYKGFRKILLIQCAG